MAEVWVWTELDGGAPLPESREAYQVAAWLASRLGGPVTALAAPEGSGSSGGYGPRSLAAAIAARAADSGGPAVLLFPATERAVVLAACAAAAMGTGLVSHAYELRLEPLSTEAGTPGSPRLAVLVPAPGGLVPITCSEPGSKLVSLGPGVAARLGLVAHQATPIYSRVEMTPEALRIAAREPRPVCRPGPSSGSGSPAFARTDARSDLTRVRVVVAGGAGAVSSGVWPQLEELAGLLGAALGATRPAVDAGVAGEERMIGQSGVWVSPELYLAFGISGDLQHTIGLEGARLVVAVNRDPAAPIFGRADIGVLADLERFVPALLEEVRRAVAAPR